MEWHSGARYFPPGEPIEEKARKIAENTYTRRPLREWSSGAIAAYIVAQQPEFPAQLLKREGMLFLDAMQAQRVAERELIRKAAERRNWIRQRPVLAYFYGIYEAVMWPAWDVTEYLRQRSARRP